MDFPKAPLLVEINLHDDASAGLLTGVLRGQGENGNYMPIRSGAGTKPQLHCGSQLPGFSLNRTYSICWSYCPSMIDSSMSLGQRVTWYGERVYA